MKRRWLVTISVLSVILGFCGCSSTTDVSDANDEKKINTDMNDEEKK